MAIDLVLSDTLRVGETSVRDAKNSLRLYMLQFWALLYVAKCVKHIDISVQLGWFINIFKIKYEEQFAKYVKEFVIN